MELNLDEFEEGIGKRTVKKPENKDAIYESQVAEDFMDLLEKSDDLELDKKVTDPILNPVYKARELDGYYDYLQSYDSGKFLKKVRNKIIGYQMYNKYIKFYRNESAPYEQKLYSGVIDDIVDLYVDKIQTTKWRFFPEGGTKEVKEEIIPLDVVRSVITSLLKYSRILVIENGIAERPIQDIVKDEILEEVEKFKLYGVEIYAPHQYDLDNKKIVLSNGKGGVKTTSFKDRKYVELDVKKGLLENKTDIVYLLNMFITNFGIENELGKTKIHADKRYVKNYNKDLYSVYDGILNGQDVEPKPIWESVQTAIRPNDHKTAVETLMYMIHRGIGLDIRGLVYMTATQTNSVTLEDTIKINNWLKILEKKINMMLKEFDIKYRISFDEFTMDTLDTDLARVKDLYIMGLLPLERATFEVYKRLGYIPEDMEIGNKEFQSVVTMIKMEKGIPATGDDQIDDMMKKDEEQEVTKGMV